MCRELENYAEERGVLFRQDESNLEEVYFRNRVRHRLVPVLASLAETYGGRERFEQRFAQTIEDIQWTVDQLGQQIDKYYRRHCVETLF